MLSKSASYRLIRPCFRRQGLAALLESRSTNSGILSPRIILHRFPSCRLHQHLPTLPSLPATRSRFCCADSSTVPFSTSSRPSFFAPFTHPLIPRHVPETPTFPNGFPIPNDAYVNDFAGLFSDSRIASFRSELESIHAETGRHILVVIVPSLSSFGGVRRIERRSIELFAKGLYQTWWWWDFVSVRESQRDEELYGMMLLEEAKKVEMMADEGEEERNSNDDRPSLPFFMYLADEESMKTDTGVVLFLVALGDRKMRVEMMGKASSPNAPDHDRSFLLQHVIDTQVVPAFRNLHFKTGIRMGLQAIVENCVDFEESEQQRGFWRRRKVKKARKRAAKRKKLDQVHLGYFRTTKKDFVGAVVVFVVLLVGIVLFGVAQRRDEREKKGGVRKK